MNNLEFQANKERLIDCKFTGIHIQNVTYQHTVYKKFMQQNTKNRRGIRQHWAENKEHKET